MIPQIKTSNNIMLKAEISSQTRSSSCQNCPSLPRLTTLSQSNWDKGSLQVGKPILWDDEMTQCTSMERQQHCVLTIAFIFLPSTPFLLNTEMILIAQLKKVCAPFPISPFHTGCDTGVHPEATLGFKHRSSSF